MTLKNDYQKYFKLKIDEINNLIDKGLVNVANQEYRGLIDYLSNSDVQIEDSLKSEVHVSYAFFLFNCGEYEGFLDELFNAQKFGYFVGEVEDILYEGFIEPNLEEFKSNYEYSLKNLLKNKSYTEKILDFSDLPYWLIPTGEKDSFYVYDKVNKQLLEKYSNKPQWQLLKNKQIYNVFSDNVFEFNGNLGKIAFGINRNNKLNFMIVKDIELLLSSLQSKRFEISFFEKIVFFFDYRKFEEYFEDTNLYLPKNIIVDDLSENVENLINSIHVKRLQTDRSREKILLSICIPSYNRGHRALESVKKLLELKYDNEIEIVVSNNGSINETSHYYDEISQIKDSRVVYYAFEGNKGFALNLCKVCELANGQYILLISDEDTIDYNVLDKIMLDLKNNKGEISIYRTSTTAQSKVRSGNYKGGIEALKSYMLSSNYVSGIILNTNLIKSLGALSFVQTNLENRVCEAYPHMYWELLLLQYGTVKGTSDILIHEGTAEKMESEMLEKDKDMTISYYATLESRLNQHKGFYEIFCDLEVPKNNQDFFREMYLTLCWKTLFLVHISINVFYKKDKNINPQEILLQAYEFCIDSKFLIGSHHERKQDIDVIEGYYKGFLANI